MKLRLNHVVLIVLLYGLGYPLGAVTLGELSAPWVLLVRFTLAGLLLVIVAVLGRRQWPRGRQWGHVVVVGLLTQAAQFGFAYEGMRLGVPPTLTALVIAMNPLTTAVLAALWLGERPTRRGVVGLLLGVAAIVLAFAGRITVDGLDAALILPLLALCGMSAGGVYQQRYLSDVDPLPASAAGQLVSAAPMAIWALVTPPDLGDPRLAVVSLAAMTVLSAAIGTTVYMAAVRRSGAARVSLLFAVIPSVAAFFDWVLRGELPGLGVVLGLVVGAIACIVGGGPARAARRRPAASAGAAPPVAEQLLRREPRVRRSRAWRDRA